MKKNLSTILVLAVLAILGTYVLLFESKPRTGEEGRDTLWNLKQSGINKVELLWPGTGSALTLERESDDAWWITSPGRYEAEPEVVDGVLKVLSAPPIERRLGEIGDPAEFGFDRPTFKATAHLKGGKSRALEAGRKNPTESGWFVREVGGKEAVTVPSGMLEAAKKSLLDLRSRTPAPFDPAKVNRLVVERQEGGTLDLRRGEGDTWKMVRPVEANADRYAAEGLLNELKGLKGTEIIDETGAHARYRLDRPLALVKIYTGKESDKPLAVSLSRPNPKREDAYVSSSRIPYVMRIPSAQPVVMATRPADDFRERLLLSANREDLREVAIDWNGRSIRCRKGWGGGFSVVEPRGARADEPMNEMLFEVIYVRVEAFVSDKPAGYRQYGLDRPPASVKVTYKRDGKTVTDSYTLGAPYSGFNCLRWGDTPAVYAVRKELLEKIRVFAEMALSGKPSEPPKGKPAGK